MKYLLPAAVLLSGAAVAATVPYLKTRTYRLTDPRLTREVRLLQISDLHDSRFGKGQARLLRAIERFHPDIICLTGDIFDDRTDNRNSALLLRALATKYPLYFVEGNHELYCAHRDENLALLRACGATILDGTQAQWEKDGQILTICGVSDPVSEDGNASARQKIRCAPPEQTFAQRLASTARPTGHYRILLSHRPERWEQYQTLPFDLILSGHAHGGQWRIPGILNGTYAPHQGWFPRHAGGLYRLAGGRIHIVSRGLSKQLKIPRIFNPPELCAILLTPPD